MINLVIYILGIITVITIVAVISLASLYDIWLTRRKQLFQAHPGARRFRHRPLITIIISGEDVTQIKHTLDSIIKSSYRKREIIIPSLKKSDQKQLRRYRSIQFTQNQKIGESSRGELVLNISGGMTIHQATLAQAVWHFNDQPNVRAVTCAATPQFYPSESHLFATYQSLVATLFFKATSIFGHVQPQHANLTICKREFMAADMPKQIIYADDASFTHLPITNFWLLLKSQQNKKWRSTIIRPYVGLLFLCVTYTTYLAMWLRQPALLTLALLGFALFLLTAIWWNNHLSWLHRCIYTALLPISIGYFYLVAAIQTLEMLTDVAKAIVPLSIGLFVRVKNILRIVE
jgi:hypothetical protein